MQPTVLPVKYNGKPAYQVYIGDSFEGAAQLADASCSLKERRVCIVTDSNVETLYADDIQAQFEAVSRSVFRYVLPAGEEHKTLDEIRKIYAFLIERGFDRHDVLVALGGGVTGDMTGFAAATYLRGIRFIQIPTTLLAQVDSSIGGKTGVDFLQYKNMVGAFHMPSMVYIAICALSTLDEEQFAGGMGEVLKHGLIKDAAYYEWTIGNMSEIAARNPAVLRELVQRSVEIKRQVVETDPEEKGERALLNFGHTIGHAIEKLKDFSLPHGHCVALGCIAAAWISFRRSQLSEEEFYEIRDMMVGFDLPISFEGPSPEEIIEALRHDKKMAAGRIRFILLKKIGKAYIDLTVTDDEITDAIRQIDARYLYA